MKQGPVIIGIPYLNMTTNIYKLWTKNSKNIYWVKKNSKDGECLHCNNQIICSENTNPIIYFDPTQNWISRVSI